LSLKKEMTIAVLAASWFLLLFPSMASAQHEGHEQHPPIAQEEKKEKEETTEPQEEHGTSGTAVEPRSTPHSMFQWRLSDWRVRLHANAFLVATQQSGPQGADKIFSVNWVMGSADRKLGRGNLEIRSMLSVEPATVTGRRYPLLFQTGETAFGEPLINAQHPHDFVMELSARYSLPLNDSTSLILYAAPVGDPALGPTGFPHRISAAELPEAPLSHHLQDSTHIVTSVFTVGVRHRWIGIEVSTFHGQEPDEHRWDLRVGPPDSFSARLTVRPTNNWHVQISHGHLNEPEEHEPGDIDRTTASLTYNRPLARGNWATSLIWGRNHKRSDHGNLNGYLLESSLQFLDRNYVFGRAENVDREGLFLTGHAEDEPIERVAAFTVGAARDLWVDPRGARLALGFDVSFYRISDELKSLYDDHPVGARLFLRLRLGGSTTAGHKH
jgi:hypothetical protein